MASAESALDQDDGLEIETFKWNGGRLRRELTKGERVLMSTEMESGKVLISPPGRVLNIKRYQVNGKPRANRVFGNSKG